MYSGDTVTGMENKPKYLERVFPAIDEIKLLLVYKNVYEDLCHQATGMR